MEDRSPESFELLALSYCHWRLMCALGIGFLACLWRFPRRQREAWLVAAAILLVAFLEVGLTLMAGRTMRFVGAIVPNLSAEQIAAWFNFLIKPLYSSLSMAAWGLIFYAALDLVAVIRRSIWSRTSDPRTRPLEKSSRIGAIHAT